MNHNYLKYSYQNYFSLNLRICKILQHRENNNQVTMGTNIKKS